MIGVTQNFVTLNIEFSIILYSSTRFISRYRVFSSDLHDFV